MHKHQLIRMSIALGTSALLIAACSSAEDVMPTSRGTVTFASSTDTIISGTYVLLDDTLSFEASSLDGTDYSVVLTLHGLTLQATVQGTDVGRVWSQDAFAAADGTDTMVVEEDVALINQFTKALEAAWPDIAYADGLPRHFDSIVNYWGMWIPAMDPKQIKFEDRDRATSLCYYAMDARDLYASNITYTSDIRYLDTSANWAGHDCGTSWLGGSNCNGDPLQGGGKNKCSSIVQLGDHSLGGYPNSYGWFSYDGSNWTTGTTGHTRGYELGDCFGRYGIDCGSGKAYNQESASHDQCVRNGRHNVVSSWCSDEFSRTTDSTGNCY